MALTAMLWFGGVSRRTADAAKKGIAQVRERLRQNRNPDLIWISKTPV
jgi:hypothetical protein